MQPDPRSAEPTEITILVPESIELIDPRQQQHPQRPQLKSRKRLALFLFVATCYSTWHVGGLAYAAAVMLILLAHEMGHYLQALRYRVPATLPFFIPETPASYGFPRTIVGQVAYLREQ